jgi:hypothetical protein
MSMRSWWLIGATLISACSFHVTGLPGVGGNGGSDMSPPPDDDGVPGDDGHAPGDGGSPLADAGAHPADLALPTPPVDLSLPPDLMPSCMQPGIIFCEDFENASLPGWAPAQFAGKVTLDQKHVLHGKNALRAHQDQSVFGASAVLLRKVAYPSPDIYVRAFLFAEAAPSTAAVLRVQESQVPQLSLDLQVSPTNFLVRDGKTGVVEPSPVALVTGRWVCVQWRLHLAGDGYATVSVDDSVPWKSAVADTAMNPPLDWLVVGLRTDGANEASDVWIDELAVSAAPIGCSAD